MRSLLAFLFTSLDVYIHGSSTTADYGQGVHTDTSAVDCTCAVGSHWVKGWHLHYHQCGHAPSVMLTLLLQSLRTCTECNIDTSTSLTMDMRWVYTLILQSLWTCTECHLDISAAVTVDMHWVSSWHFCCSHCGHGHALRVMMMCQSSTADC